MASVDQGISVLELNSFRKAVPELNCSRGETFENQGLRSDCIDKTELAA